MAAELEYRDGKANMFYANQTPWHREGVKIEGEEQFAFDDLMAKHFEYPLEKRPYFLPEDPTAEPDQRVYVQDSGASYIWRPDIKKSLGSVGGAYEIVTNKEAFEVLKPLVDQRVAAIETGGVLRDGADAWLLVRWDLDRFGSDVKEVFGKDGGILPYALVAANHSGRRGVLMGMTPVRVVCQNTLSMAERESENGRSSNRWRVVSHRHGAKEKLVEAAQELFQGVIQKYEIIAKQYRLLMQTALPNSDFTRLVLDVVAPDPRKDPKFNPDAKLAETVLERAMRKRAEVRRLWKEGKGHTGEENAWFALNATVEAIDFNKEMWPTRSGSWRTASLMNGQLADLKNKVMDNLVSFAMSA